MHACVRCLICFLGTLFGAFLESKLYCVHVCLACAFGYGMVLAGLDYWFPLFAHFMQHVRLSRWDYGIMGAESVDLFLRMHAGCTGKLKRSMPGAVLRQLIAHFIVAQVESDQTLFGIELAFGGHVMERIAPS